MHTEGLRVGVSRSEGAIQVLTGAYSQRKGGRAWSPERTVEVTRVFQGSVKGTGRAVAWTLSIQVCLEGH